MMSLNRLLVAAALTLFCLAPSAAFASPPGESPLKECDPNEVRPRMHDWLPGLMKVEPVLQKVMQRGHELRFQMVVGEVMKPESGKTCLRLTKYRHGAEYTYPASSIKIVGAIGAMKVMQDTPGWSLTTPVRIARLEREFDGTKFEISPGTETTMQELLDDTLIVSSNTAFNSLYDIAGRPLLNKLMHDAGFDSVRMWHRLSQTTAPEAAHAWAPKVEIQVDGKWKKVRDVRGPAADLKPHPAKKTKLGVAYVDPVTKERVDEPMDFSKKNGISMRDLLALTVAMERPDLLSKKAPFGLSPASRKAIVKAMTQRPTGENEGEIRALEARFKPLSPGVLTAYEGKRDAFEYVNKAGRAYGFHLDSAYVRDRKSNRAYFVAVTMWPNENQVLNDNEYEYDELSYPAMTALGKVLTYALLRNVIRR